MNTGTSTLLRTGKQYPVHAWEAEIEVWNVKLAKAVKQRDDLQAQFDNINTPDDFRRDNRPALTVFTDVVLHCERVVASLKAKLNDAKAAQASHIAEAKAAQAERDDLAKELKTDLPAMLAQLAELLQRVEANEARLLACAVAGEGDIDSTSPWDRARGRTKPLTLQGASAAPSIKLSNLDGEHVFATPTHVHIPYKRQPLKITVKNASHEPFLYPGILGSVHSIDAGATKVMKPQVYFDSKDSLEITAES